MSADDETGGSAERWAALAADLGGQAGATEAAERRALTDEVARAERASVTVAERMSGAVGREVRLVVRGVDHLHGTVADVGEDWALVDEAHGRSLVLLVALLSVSGLGTRAGAGGVPRRDAQPRSLGHQLRRLARDRAAVRVVLQSGAVLRGTVEAVGADHCEVAAHRFGDTHHERTSERTLVPFAALSVVTDLH